MKRAVMLAAFVLLSLMVAGRPVHAYYDTASDLIEGANEYEKNESGVKDVNWYTIGTYCGYVTGVFDCVENKLCTPDQMKVRQVIAIANKYLKDHPEQWSEPAAGVLIKAFKQAFPCKK